MASHPQWAAITGTAAEIYEQHLVPAMFAPWVPPLLNLAHLHPNDRVLDVACGTGAVTHQAAARVGSNGRVVGLDINQAMLAVARSHSGSERAPIEWLEASALDIPLPDATFDVVLCQQGLQQFPDRAAALGEMHRVLVTGGRLVISVWSRIESNPGMAALVDSLERHVGRAAADNRRAPFALGDADELRALVIGAGFRQFEIHTLTEIARFLSPESLVEAQLAATPLSTLGTVSEEIRQAVAHDVRAALQMYLEGERFTVPMETHIAIASK